MAKTNPINDLPPVPKTTGPRLSRRSALALGALGAAAGLAGYAFGVEPRWVSVEHHELPIPRLPNHLVGKTAVQISDTHVGHRVDSEFLRRQFEYVSSLNPDFVFFTGDYIDRASQWHVDEGIKLLDFFPRGHFGTACILGNHDYAGSGHRDQTLENVGATERLVEAFRDADGLELLIDETVEMNGLHVGGLPDLWYGGFRRSLTKRTVAKVAAHPSIVLSHNPDSVDIPIWGGFDGWVLCGHTHGGQCTFPVVGAPILPVKNRDYVSGAYQVGDQFQMFINRGIGHTTRVRFLARPEITVFTLRQPDPPLIV
jgi:predicted MPP superfamily phosphohydrolase